MILSKPKHNDLQALSKWILPCIQGFCTIFGEFKDEAVTIIPDSSSALKEYIDGTKVIEKTYCIQCYFSVAEDYKIFNIESAENSENIQEFELAQSINQWIYDQNNLENFPQVDGMTCEKIEPTSSMPNFDGVDTSGNVNLARYSIFVKATYKVNT